MIWAKKIPERVQPLPGMESNPQKKEEDMGTISPSTDTVHSIDAGDGFAHTVRLYTYEGFSHPEVVVAFGGQGSVGDLHTAEEARGLALALLAVANQLDLINGRLEIPVLERQFADDEPGWLEAKWAGKGGDFYWLTPESPDVKGVGIAIDADRDDRSPDAARQLIIELSMNLTILEALTS